MVTAGHVWFLKLSPSPKGKEKDDSVVYSMVIK